MIKKAQEEERDACLFQQWTAQLGTMALSGEALGFAEYKARVTGANIDLRPTSQIMAELEEVEQEFTKE